MAIAAQRGMIEEYDFPGTERWQNQPDNNLWRNYGLNGRPIVYNTNALSQADAPRTHDELVDNPQKYSKFRYVATTSGEDTPLYYASMFGGGATLDWDKSFDWWRKFVNQYKPAVQSGFTGVIELVSAGEFDIMPGATTSAVFGLVKRGAPVAIAPTDVVPYQVGPRVALAKNAPHPNAARLWIDFYNTPEGWAAYANQTDFHAPMELPEYTSEASKMLEGLGKPVIIPDELVNEENLKKSSEFYLNELGIRQATKN
jgi:ABC-type Fe3+ transport system substrate-binding protein